MSNYNNICYGICRCFDRSKGYGFIIPNDNTSDVFVHFSDINSNSSFKSINKGDTVQYISILANNGKRKAINVSVINNNFKQNRNANNGTVPLRQQPLNQQLPQYNNTQNMHYMNHMTNMSVNNMKSNNTSMGQQYIQQIQAHQAAQQQQQRKQSNNNTVTSTMRQNRQPKTDKPCTSNQFIEPVTDNEYKTSNDCSTTMKFKWQWLDDSNQWKDFENDTNALICSQNMNHIYYAIGDFSYRLVINPNNANKAVQINLTTNTQRQCRKLQKNFTVHQGLTLEKMLDSSWNNKYPTWWFDKDSKLHDAQLVEWPLDNEICVEITDLFNKSANQFGVDYGIQSIYSVQNKFLWKQYQFARELHSEALGPNKLNERYLFHGTEYDSAEKITVQGFLRDHGKVMAYGRGTYFAKDASMSVDYAHSDDNNYQWMFLCAVVLGESVMGQKRFTVPPTKPNSSVHYESMVDDVINPKIFVISKDYQAYPLFLIKFKTDSLCHGLRMSFGAPSPNQNKSKPRHKSSQSLIPVKMKGNYSDTCLKKIGSKKQKMSMPFVPNLNSQNIIGAPLFPNLNSQSLVGNMNLPQLKRNLSLHPWHAPSYNVSNVPNSAVLRAPKLGPIPAPMAQIKYSNRNMNANINLSVNVPNIATLSSRYIGNPPPPPPSIFSIHNSIPKNGNNLGNVNNFKNGNSFGAMVNSTPMNTQNNNGITISKRQLSSANNIMPYPMANTIQNLSAKNLKLNTKLCGLNLSPISEIPTPESCSNSLIVQSPRSQASSVHSLMPYPSYLNSQPNMDSPLDLTDNNMLTF